LIVRLLVFQWFHLYVGLWRYVSIRDIVVILSVETLSSVGLSAGILALHGRAFPVSVLVIDWVFCLDLVSGVRLTLRVIRESRLRGRNSETRRALVVGAGDAGETLLRELSRSSGEYDIVGVVDDEPAKQHMRIHGVEVVGTVDQLDTLAHSLEAHEILIAIPSATAEGSAAASWTGAEQASCPSGRCRRSTICSGGAPRSASSRRYGQRTCHGRADPDLRSRQESHPARGHGAGPRRPARGDGASPGERLREELVTANEELLPTPHEKIRMLHNHNFDAADFERDLEELRGWVQGRDRERAVALLRQMSARDSYPMTEAAGCWSP
jgi:FlaA1/EpsC-like NDP-sugar epimerase